MRGTLTYVTKLISLSLRLYNEVKDIKLFVTMNESRFVGREAMARYTAGTYEQADYLERTWTPSLTFDTACYVISQFVTIVVGLCYLLFS